MNGISSLLEDTPQSPALFLPCEDQARRRPSTNHEAGLTRQQSTDILILDSSLQNYEKKVLLLISHPVHSIFVMKPKQTKILTNTYKCVEDFETQICSI